MKIGKRLAAAGGLIASLLFGGSMAESFWERIGWETFKETAAETVAAVLADLIRDGLTPEKVTALEQQVTELQTQLAERQAGDSGPAAAELAPVKQSLAQAETLLQQVQAGHGGLEQRVALLEADFAALRDSLYAYAPAEAAKLPKPAVAVNYSYRPQGEAAFRELRNGSVLQSGDLYKITFTPEQDGYVYIFQTDSSDTLYQLFPLDRFKGVELNLANPVKAGTTYHVPAPRKSFFLDARTGTEKIYFIAAPQRDEPLEQQYQTLLAARNQGADEQPATRGLTTLIRSRGPGGVMGDAAACKTRGPGGVAADCPQQEVADETEVSVLDKRWLAGLCEDQKGCVNVLTFSHE